MKEAMEITKVNQLDIEKQRARTKNKKNKAKDVSAELKEDSSDEKPDSVEIRGKDNSQVFTGQAAELIKLRAK